MKAAFRLGLRFVSILLMTVSAWAATFQVPTDENLVKRADAIVHGVVLDSHSELDSAGQIVTVTTLRVHEILKGTEIQGTVLITELGGIVGRRGLGVSGSATYSPGEVVLVFLQRIDGGFRTWGMVLGKFGLVTDERGNRFAIRGSFEEPIFGWNEADWTLYDERPRDAERFLAFVRAVSRGDRGQPDYFVEPSRGPEAPKIRVMNHFPAGVYTRGPDQPGAATRWKRFDSAQAVNFTASGSADATQQSAAAFGTGIWAGHGASNIDTLAYTGTSANPFMIGDGLNTIVFNVPGTDPNLTGATVGYAQWSFFPADGTNVKNGTSFGTIIEGDVKIEVGVAGNNLRQTVAHEVGHTLGFRHSNVAFPGEPSGPGIMNSSVSGVVSLSTWDQEAANHVYGDGTLGGGPPPCTNVTIAAHPVSTTIAAGGTANLSVTASGTAPFTYQWHIGTTGTINPIPGATSASISVSPASTTNYWVRVTNCSGAGTADSNTATVTVTPCVPPSISSQPPNRTITAGQTTSLNVVAGGTSPFTYQWFIGASGDTGSPIPGATGSSVNVSPGTTTSYWVRVTGQCGSPANSNTATVTVAPCTSPTITTHPQSTSVTTGGSASLFVTATGSSPLTIQWFRGNRGDTSSGVQGTGSSFNTGPLTSTTTFWARVSNTCGTRDSNSATVTVETVCTAPNITSHPQGTTIQTGQSATLTVSATGTSLIYEWFRGLSGDTSSGVLGTNPSFDTGALTESARFWVRVRNSCGSRDSNAALVAVQPPCPPGHVCLLNGRFEIALFARDQRTGATATGQPAPENDLFAFFSLASLTGSTEIPEVFVKILDATSLPGQNFWVFYSGLTDLEYSLVITDKQKNQQKIFTKEAGSLCGNTDQSTFTLDAGSEQYAAATPGNTSANAIEPNFTCGAASLCLLSTRFDISLSARDQRTGRTATGIPVPKADGFGYFSLTELTGDPRVPEVFVKMIDATVPPFNKFWVFHGGLTDLEYTLTVRDNARGTVKTYRKEPGSFCGEADTAAFDP